jgi:hypothetical protein
MKTIKTVQTLDQKIAEIKNRLLALGPMHPGSISQQYHVCQQPGCRCMAPQNPQRHGPYSKLSYVYHGKATCRFVRPQWVEALSTQLEVYKSFRSLMDQWVALSIQRAQLSFFQPAPQNSPSHRSHTSIVSKVSKKKRQSKRQS